MPGGTRAQTRVEIKDSGSGLTVTPTRNAPSGVGDLRLHHLRHLYHLKIERLRHRDHRRHRHHHQSSVPLSERPRRSSAALSYRDRPLGEKALL